MIEKPARYFLPYFCRFLIVSISLQISGLLTIAQVAETNVPNRFPITFESFLTNPPAILNAEFEINQSISPEFLATHPNVNTVNDCILRIDQTNYILYRPNLSTYTGQFGSIVWRHVWESPLMLADQRINTPKTLSDVVGLSKWPINRFLNLGIQEMLPGTLVWVEGADNFTAKCQRDLSDESSTNLGTINVHLNYVNGVPLTATTKDSWGGGTKITYTYDPAFYEGKLPVAFDVDVERFGVDMEKMFGLQIKKLQLSTKPIESDQFDPKIALKGNYRGLIVYSNDLSYSVLRTGRVVPTLTAQEAQKLTTDAEVAKHPKGAYTLSVALLIIIFVPLILGCVKYFQQKNNKPR